MITRGNLVKFFDYRGNYRIQISRKIYKKRFMDTGLSADDSDNLNKVQNIVLSIQRDIINKEFDSTLERYRPKKHVYIGQNLPIKELYDLFCESKQPRLARTTYELGYRGHYLSLIKKIAARNLTTAKNIEAYLYEYHPPYTTKNMLQILEAMYQWAIDERYLSGENPFRGKALLVKLHRKDGYDIDPFSFDEVVQIIERFKQDSPHYVPFVRFLFLTGCRPGEATALHWRNVARDFSTVVFRESYNPELKLIKDTKTHKSRIFPCNETLREVLASVPRRSDDNPVFFNHWGCRINQHAFCQYQWRGTPNDPGVIARLVNDGEVLRYRSLYNTRRTFITEALNNGLSLPKVARVTGTSANVIMEHYFSSRYDGDIPVNYGL